MTLGVLVTFILSYGSRLGIVDVPPIEDISIQRVTLDGGGIVLEVFCNGPDPVTIAQVSVDDAFWSFTISPSREMKRMDSAKITIPYPWVSGEAHKVALLTSTGVTFEHEIPVAIESPKADSRTIGMFALIGLAIGVVPVALGLLWYPVVGGLSAKALRFFLALTVGLLVFLGIDTILEGLEIAESVPGPLKGKALFFVVSMTSLLALVSLGGVRRHGKEISLAFLVALGIGLHNLGEGLAVGTAYALGEIGVGATLILGFTLHNVTEGLAIVAPAAKSKIGVWKVVGLGAIAGVPTIFGTVLGGVSRSNFWALVFFAIAAGAIFQVVVAIATSPLMRSEENKLFSRENIFGFVIGLLAMYTTALMVAA